MRPQSTTQDMFLSTTKLKSLSIYQTSFTQSSIKDSEATCPAIILMSTPDVPIWRALLKPLVARIELNLYSNYSKKQGQILPVACNQLSQ